MGDVDVVIVGAGSSGFAAAKVLRAAGKDSRGSGCLGRIGGRPFTSSEHFGVPFAIASGFAGARAFPVKPGRGR